MKKTSCETDVVFETQQPKTKRFTRIDPLAFSNNEDLVEAYPSQGICGFLNVLKYYTI